MDTSWPSQIDKVNHHTTESASYAFHLICIIMNVDNVKCISSGPISFQCRDYPFVCRKPQSHCFLDLFPGSLSTKRYSMIKIIWDGLFVKMCKKYRETTWDRIMVEYQWSNYYPRSIEVSGGGVSRSGRRQYPGRSSDTQGRDPASPRSPHREKTRKLNIPWPPSPSSFWSAFDGFHIGIPRWEYRAHWNQCAHNQGTHNQQRVGAGLQ